jgi:ABC-2 type transport system permease protein
MHEEIFSLVNNGFEMLTLSPGQDIPPDIATLVIADPIMPFTTTELEKIRRYIASGGNMLIAGEGGRGVGDGGPGVLDPLLDSLGVHFIKGNVTQPGEDHADGLVSARFLPGALNDTASWKSDWTVSMPGVTGLRYGENGPFKFLPVLAADNCIAYKSVPVALALTRQVGQREQRIFISGDADFMDNDEISRQRASNHDFVLDLFNWFSYGEYPVKVACPIEYNTIRINLREANRLKLLLVFLLPALLALTGSIFLIARKRM